MSEEQIGEKHFVRILFIRLHLLSLSFCCCLVDSDAGRDWGQEEKEMTEDKMAGWHHRLDEHEFE